jgi:hypothetical protein
VCNSSPLIWLAKAGRLTVLRRLFGEVSIPRVVYDEVSLGESADSLLIREAVEEEWIRVVDVEEGGARDIVEVSGIHRGEAEAILLARGVGALFVVDDREGSATARVFGVATLGTVGLLLLALGEGLFGLDEFVDCLDALMGLGFRLSVEVYRRALAEARRIAGERAS